MRGQFAGTIRGEVLLVYYCIYTSTRARGIPAHGTGGLEANPVIIEMLSLTMCDTIEGVQSLTLTMCDTIEGVVPDPDPDTRIIRGHRLPISRYRDKLFATYRDQIAVLKMVDFFYNARFS